MRISDYEEGFINFSLFQRGPSVGNKVISDDLDGLPYIALIDSVGHMTHDYIAT